MGTVLDANDTNIHITIDLQFVIIIKGNGDNVMVTTKTIPEDPYPQFLKYDARIAPEFSNSGSQMVNISNLQLMLY